MRQTSFANMHCSLARSLEKVGDWWTPLILRDVFLGLRRFDQLQESLGIARNVLTERLTRLVDAGVLERFPYSEHPIRYEYRLTPKGIDLNVALAALRQWGDRYLCEDPPRLLRRKTDKQPVIAALVPEGTRVLQPDEVESVPGRSSTRAR